MRRAANCGHRCYRRLWNCWEWCPRLVHIVACLSTGGSWFCRRRWWWWWWLCIRVAWAGAVPQILPETFRCDIKMEHSFAEANIAAKIMIAMMWRQNNGCGVGVGGPDGGWFMVASCVYCHVECRPHLQAVSIRRAKTSVEKRTEY
ncbi:hypothetical protein MPH_02482 [Macrophomina phaseolina MS6]|uniref:Uncharacterized protein n=1 Tax=Macrophomina phaseolina (strain MS6) TaxID=1126212 RepID=K2SCW2_MACPH|nr:hypothetical protein MPH_02482 [Macrophomina phaseolina MS6]